MRVYSLLALGLAAGVMAATPDQAQDLLHYAPLNDGKIDANIDPANLSKITKVIPGEPTDRGQVPEFLDLINKLEGSEPSIADLARLAVLHQALASQWPVTSVEQAYGTTEAGMQLQKLVKDFKPDLTRRRRDITQIADTASKGLYPAFLEEWDAGRLDKAALIGAEIVKHDREPFIKALGTDVDAQKIMAMIDTLASSVAKFGKRSEAAHKRMAH